ARSVVPDVGRNGDGSRPPQGHAARSVRRGTRRRPRGKLDGGRLLQGEPHHGEALRGVQGTARQERGGLPQAAQDAPWGRTVTADLGYGMTIVALGLALYGGDAAGGGGPAGAGGVGRAGAAPGGGGGVGRAPPLCAP